MHSVKDVLTLDANGQSLLFAGLTQNVGHFTDGLLTGGGIHQHDHGEILLQNGLGDVQNVDVVLSQQGTDRGGDTIYKNIPKLFITFINL